MSFFDDMLDENVRLGLRWNPSKLPPSAYIRKRNMRPNRWYIIYTKRAGMRRWLLCRNGHIFGGAATWDGILRTAAVVLNRGEA